MKRIIIALTGVLLALTAPAALAGARPYGHRTSQPAATACVTTVRGDFSCGVCTGSPGGASQAYLAKYCAVYGPGGTYGQVYCYPNGTYWQAQIKASPAYYAAHSAYYLAKDGC